jgi:hypothetical protein
VDVPAHPSDVRRVPTSPARASDIRARSPCRASRVSKAALEVMSSRFEWTETNHNHAHDAESSRPVESLGRTKRRKLFRRRRESKHRRMLRGIGGNFEARLTAMTRYSFTRRPQHFTMHVTHPTMNIEAPRGVETRARKRKRVRDEQAGVAFPGLPNDVAVSIVEKHLPDPADLAVLRAVSRGMRDAVDATWRQIYELREDPAAECGYLSTLKCLRRQGRLNNESLLCAAAARNGDLDELKRFHAKKIRWDKLTCAFAAEGGHFELLKWAREHGAPWDEYTCSYAAMRGDFKMLKWLRENKCPWNEYTCSYAAEGGHLEILKWARKNGCPWNKYTCAGAAGRGHLEILKWARENGCPWDRWTCEHAALFGHLEMLKWARENGCPWDWRTCENAALGGHLEILKWARENGCPWDEHTCSSAAAGGHLDVLKWARANGCEWDENTCEAAAVGSHVEALNWARENGAPWSPKIREFAVTH